MPFSMQGWDKVLEMLEQRLGKFAFKLMLYMIWLAIIAGCVGIVLDQVAIRVYKFFDDLFAGKVRIFDNSPQIFATLLVLIVLVVVLIFVVRLIASLTKRRVPQAAINELADHRSAGISVLNDVPPNEAVLPAWHAKWLAWRDKVVETLRKNFTHAETLSFDRLGVIREAPFGIAVNNEHQHYLRQLSKQLTILENMIQQHQERR